MRWRESLRLHSMQVHALMVSAVVWLAKQNDNIMSAFNGLPSDIRSKMPYVIGFVLMAFGIFARTVSQQKKPDGSK
jgi:hypothetical protein